MSSALRCGKVLQTYRGVVKDDITAGHIAMENVFFQVLNERPLQSQRDKAEEGGLKCLWLIFTFVLNI